MPLVVNSNIASLVAQRYLGGNSNQLQKSFERLSSGFRINRAADDSAGLAISESLSSLIRGFEMADKNAQDGISVLQIAEGALTSIGESLQRMRELTVQAANDTNSSAERNAIEQEIQQLVTEITRLSTATSFNGLTLLNGSMATTFIQIGPNSSITQNTIDISSALATTNATTLGILGTTTSAGFSQIASIDISNSSVARAFITDLDAAITALNRRRSLIGAYDNQLQSVITNIGLNIENFSSSLSRIRDLDIAKETSNLNKWQVLQQSSLSILTQANQSAQQVLSLLQR